MSAPVPGPPRPGQFGARPGQHFPAPHPGQHVQGSQSAQDGPGEDVDVSGGSGHPAVDAVLGSLSNAAQLAPADQVAEYEAAHRVLQETLAGIDRA